MNSIGSRVIAVLRHTARLCLLEPRLILRYISAGASAACVEFALFTILFELARWPLLEANCSAFSVAVLLCFLLQKKWTFRAGGETTRQLRLYLFMQLVSAVLNNLLMFGLVEGLALYAPLAKLLQIGIVFIWNFSFCRIAVFPLPLSGDSERIG